MVNDEANESYDQSVNNREVELDLLQRRLHNKTQRVARVIQFNIVALSLVAAIVQFAKPPDELTPTIMIGGTIMLISIFLSIVGISLNVASFSWTQKTSSNRPNADSLISEYRLRNQYLSLLMPAAIGAGGFGVAIILIGALRLGGINSAVPWSVSGSAVFVSLVGGSVVGSYLAQSIGTQ